MLACCLMGNHQLVLTTRRPNLSALTRHVNGVYTQDFNRRHGKVGHVFQGRFKSILVDREAHFPELCRYVELNPVRAVMVQVPQDWPWSSFLAHAGLATCPPWLFLGDELFVERMQAQAPQASLRSRAVPRPQRSRPISLAQCLQASSSRSEALYRAYVEGGLTMTAIAKDLGLSLGRVSQLVKQHAAAAIGSH